VKLIKELDTRRCSGNVKRRFGLFLCPKCGKEKEMQKRLGLKQKTCGCKNNLEGKIINGIKIIKDNFGTRKEVVAECPYCGKEFTTLAQSIKSGATSSCGCASIQLAVDKNKKHGLSNHRLYLIYRGMVNRCNNKNSNAYKYYGGKGVYICDEWIESNTNFFEWAFNNGYRDDLSLDRIDPYGNYEPSNCRWVTNRVQARNTRKLQKNNTSGYRGVSYCKERGKFLAQITVDYIVIRLGAFDNAVDAAYAYDEYVKKHQLEHTLNFANKHESQEKYEHIAKENWEKYANANRS